MSDAIGLEAREYEREVVLRILLTRYPDELSFEELRRRLGLQLGRTVPPRSLLFHIYYLLEGGYIERRAMRDFTFCKITKKGIDLLDRRFPRDPGVGL